MFIRFPGLMAIARRMVPGSQENPDHIIGLCTRCAQDVVYADGDTDAEGRPRHDRCEGTDIHARHGRFKARLAFAVLLTDKEVANALRPHLRETVTPGAGVDAATAIAAIDAAVPLIGIDGTRPLVSRRNVIARLRIVRQKLLAA